MSISANDVADGIVLKGSQFNEPMRVIGNPAAGDGFVLVNLVGTRSKTFRGGVTHCDTTPKLEEPIKDPARFPWHEVKKVEHYRLEVNAMTQPRELKEDAPPYGGGRRNAFGTSRQLTTKSLLRMSMSVLRHTDHLLPAQHA